MKLTAKGEALCFTDPSGATWGSGGSHTLDTRAMSTESVLFVPFSLEI